MTIQRTIATLMVVFILGLVSVVANAADYPQTDANGVTTIHLDEYNGYFAAEETIAKLEPGKYRFVITNKAGKLVGWQIQDLKTKETLDKFPLDPGQTRESVVTITENGFRYRCPINPTPWYEVSL